MFNRILVAMDSSAIGKYVFNEALSLAKATNTKLLLFHVLSPEQNGNLYTPMMTSLEYYPVMVSGKTQEIYQQQWEKFENLGLELLRSRTDEATAAGISTEFTQVSGNPGPTICNFARSWGAELIVIGRRGHSGLTELILGSVSNYVLYHASCSVLIVQHLSELSPQSTIDQSSQVDVS